MTNPDSAGGLLPCPFCGSAAERIDFGVGSGDNEGGSCIACTKCQASGPVEFGYKENFVSNWNRRAELCRAAPAAVERCDSCDGTALLHRADGMYVGECHCVHSAHAGGDVRHSTHHVRRGPESLPCYCGAFTDHQIGDEQ